MAPFFGATVIFSIIVSQARQKRLLSDEHFTVDGTLVEAWAGQKSFQAKKDAGDLKSPPQGRMSPISPSWVRR